MKRMILAPIQEPQEATYGEVYRALMVSVGEGLRSLTKAQRALLADMSEIASSLGDKPRETQSGEYEIMVAGPPLVAPEDDDDYEPAEAKEEGKIGF